MATIEKLRQQYHKQICKQIIFTKPGNKPSMADVDNKSSVELARGLMRRLQYPCLIKPITGQEAGNRLERISKDFLQNAFGLLEHLRPGMWHFSVHGSIADFDQYKHLSVLHQLAKKHKELMTALGDYVITPDIVVSRQPIPDSEINSKQDVVSDASHPRYTPLRKTNALGPTLHASISCKWTIRSDRSQNARTEGLNLIRNRKGQTPHIAVITGEPLLSRIASLALGTGDIDCVYHFALHELIDAVNDLKDQNIFETLSILLEGRRLRDIADLPFDLAI